MWGWVDGYEKSFFTTFKPFSFKSSQTMKTRKTVLVFTVAIALLSCKKEIKENPISKNPCDEATTFTDLRDGQTYKIVKIGSQCWFAENLRYSGDIPHIIGESNWAAFWNNGNPIAQPAWCYYDDNPINDATYGKMYNWYAVNTGTLCPPGWRIPSDADWRILTDYLGGDSLAGGKMKSTTGWNPPNTDATNSSGFTGLPGGNRFFDGLFYSIGNNGTWWSSTEGSLLYAVYRNLNYNQGEIDRSGSHKTNGFSCRCVSD
jgi:uncharacterized protein (TIGR02145 family)